MDCKYKMENGKCEKDKKTKCNNNEQNMSDWFSAELDTISIYEMCENKSLFANWYFAISKEQIEELLQGKVLCSGVEEYGVFIKLIGKDDNVDT